VTYSEAPTYKYDVISTLQYPCHRHHPAKAAAERAPATRTSCVKGGVEALSRMVKTTRSPQQRRHSSISYTPRIWPGDATLPGARRGGVSPPCERRERALWPTPTAVRQQLMHLQNINSPLQAVFVHAVLGSGGPRWHPLNSSDRHALLARRQLERILAGGNGDGSIQL
jgi:hypothetical protein